MEGFLAWNPSLEGGRETLCQEESMEAYARPCLLCPNSFHWSLALGGAMLSPAFDRSWSSSDFRPSAKVFGENGVLGEQKSPSELAWGVVFGAGTLRL